MENYKKNTTLAVVALFLFVGVISGCGGGSGGGVTPHTLAVPSLDNIRTALGTNNIYGMVPELTFGEITIPACTQSDGSAIDFNVTYSISDLPSWLSFDASTRAISLASGTTFPTDAYTASSITYTCTDDSDPTITASTDPFTINDLDGGGAVDGREYQNGAVPLLIEYGWYWLNPENVGLYRIGTSSFRIPTGLTVPTVGMDPTVAADDTEDFDNDDGVTGGGTNAAEITNGTNIFVHASTGLSTTPASYGSNSYGAAVMAADLNNDDYIDLVTSNLIMDTISILLNDGDGTFALQTGEYPPTGIHPIGIATADLTNDGYIDLAVANYNGGAGTTVTILINDGDGTFTPGTELTGMSVPTLLIPADFDGDENTDLAVINADGATTGVSLFLGNGNGTFGTKHNYATGNNPGGISAGDIDNDGDIDLVVSNSDDDTLSVLLGDGDGAFIEYAGTRPSTGDTPGALALADFNDDGYLDIVVPNSGAGAGVNTFSVFEGNGDGSFTAQDPVTVVSLPRALVAADFDGDGNIDVAVSNTGATVMGGYGGTKLSIFLGNGNLTFTEYSSSPITTPAGPIGLADADFDNDGDVDLAVISLMNTVVDPVAVFLNE